MLAGFFIVGWRGEGGLAVPKVKVKRDGAAENAMIKQLTGTDQSVGRC